MKVFTEISLEWLHARVVERDGCFDWQGYGGRDGVGPQARIGGRCVSVRRALWETVHGERAPRSMLAGVSCGNPDCVHPDHVVMRPRRALLEGIRRPVLQRAKTAAVKRAESRWSQDVIDEIRGGDELARVVAARHGMHPSYVHYIRSGKSRKDFANPYLQLAA